MAARQPQPKYSDNQPFRPINMLDAVKLLEREGGFTSQQAEAQVRVFAGIFEHHACTKQDLAKAEERMTYAMSASEERLARIIAEGNAKQTLELEKLRHENKLEFEKVRQEGKESDERIAQQGKESESRLLLALEKVWHENKLEIEKARHEGKLNIENVRLEVEKVKNHLIYWVIGTGISVSGLTFTFLKLMH